MAGLIPQSFIDELLGRVDIVDVIDKRVKLRKTGKNYSALCPFHQEKSPSFSVEPDKQFYYCFGCGAGGNALGFVMEFDNKDFPQAVESLAADCGLQVPREQEDKAGQQRREQHQTVLDTLSEASRYYQMQLRQHSERERAVTYLKSRGLTGEIALLYGIGLAPPGWDNLLKHLLGKSVDRQIQETAGLIIRRDEERMREGQDTHYDRFRDRIMFPIRDSRGRVIGFGGRVLGDDKPKYLNSPETPVYHKGRELYGLYEARKQQRRLSRVVMVEGYMDVIALAQHGISYAVATLGTSASSTHLQRLFRLVPEVVFCFDGDDAGRSAAWRALQTALPMMEDGRHIRFLFLPQGEDPDTLVRKEGQQGFETRLAGARTLSDFLFDKLSESLDLDSIDDRARLASDALPLLRQLPDNVYRELMLDRLSQLTGTQRSTIDHMLDKTAAPPAAPATGSGPTTGSAAAGADTSEPPPYLDQVPPPPGSGPRPDARPQRAGARVNKPASVIAIELLLYKPELARSLDRDLSPLKALDDANTNMFLELIELAKNNPTTTTYTMLGHCYGTPMGKQLTQLLNNETITPAVGVDGEFHYIVDAMLKVAEKRKLRQQLMEQLRPKLRSQNSSSNESSRK